MPPVQVAEDVEGAETEAANKESAKVLNSIHDKKYRDIRWS